MTTAPSICEDILHENGLWPVAGVDEAGRGPLAGPVVACALILPAGLIIKGINDSKKVTALRRVKLANVIKEAAVAYSFGIVSPEEIDRINILQATMLAMTTAISNLDPASKVALVDGTTPPPCPCPVIYMKKGDSISHLIAAASILAKVERDTIMDELHTQYPIYGFNSHKGYGTAAHRDAIRKYGLCPQHRRSFCGKL